MKAVTLIALLALSCEHAPERNQELDAAGVRRIVNDGIPEDLPPCGEHQEPVTELLSWEGLTVAKTVTGQGPEEVAYRVLDVAAGAHSPLRVGGVERVLVLAAGREGPAWVLGREGGALKLLAVTAGRYREVFLPPGLREPVARWALSAEGAELVLSDGKHLYWHSAGSWEQLPWPQVSGPFGVTWTVADAHFALFEGTLYIGYDLGEFGGGLFELKRGQAAVKSVCREDSPEGLGVVALHAASGRLWILQSVSHMGHVAARLSELDASGCRRSFSVSSDDTAGVPRLDAMTLDARGTPFTLGWNGVVKRTESGWTALTPELGTYLDTLWCRPASEPRSRFGAATRSLAIVGNEAVLGTDGFGLLLWDLETQEVRRVTLPPAGEWWGGA